MRSKFSISRLGTAASTAILGTLAIVALPVPALANSASVDYFRARTVKTEVPQILSAGDREYYRALFSAINRADWTAVDAMFAQRGDGPLHAVARAEYYLAATSPRVEAEPLAALLNEARDLPKADQLARLAAKRGATDLPGLPQAQRLVRLDAPTKRVLPRGVGDGTMPSTISSAILDRIKNDDPMGARQLLDGVDSQLSAEARAEWRQRVAWSFYIENDDGAALALARTVPEGAGAWVGEGYWVQGLAAWRMGDCAEAAGAFENTANRAYNEELSSAGAYWASRAWLRCGKPDKVADNLRAAAKRGETLYGMLAAEALGMREQGAPRPADFSSDDWKALREVPNVRAAVSLAEIGQEDLAGDMLRHQATIGEPRQYEALTRLARDLGLPSTQLWMAYNAPSGGRPDESSRYPSPRWTPVTGWKVDPALVYAHALQESNFRTSVVSPAQAMGLMQITPITVRHHAPALNMNAGSVNINDPQVNLAFGQENLEMLRDSSATGGLLPKIMAAYNAGLSPITRWNSEIRDQGDPLLYMESIPYWETRGYVAIVMRNFWMYEKQASAPSDSRRGLAANLWPKFPGLEGAESVRIASRGN